LEILRAQSFHPPVLRHGLLEADLEGARGQPLALYGVHLAAPAFTLPVELYRLRELGVILNRIQAAGRERVVVAGDFNSIAPGDEVNLRGVSWFVRASLVLQGSLFARRVIARMQQKGFVDGYRCASKGSGFTFPADAPRARLDYVFTSASLAPHIKACEVVTNPDSVERASDHLPVRLELDLRGLAVSQLEVRA